MAPSGVCGMSTGFVTIVRTYVCAETDVGSTGPLNQMLLRSSQLEVPTTGSLFPEVWPGLMEPVEVGSGVGMPVLPAGAKTLKLTHSRIVGS